MDSEAQTEIIKSLESSMGEKDFYQDVFDRVAKMVKQLRGKKNRLLEKVCAEEYEGLSLRFDRTEIQESCSVRNNLKTRRLAMLLIDDRGFLRESLLASLIVIFEEHLYSLAPSRDVDADRQRHILRFLKALNERDDLKKLLKKVSKPFFNKQVDDLIRDTLALESSTLITDAYARRAVLSACLAYLRQSVGSCFATAPAIIVHDEQFESFLKDMVDLMGKSALTRTFAGKHYSVPISSSSGIGDLKKPVYLYWDIVHSDIPLWESPGLIVAFTALDLIDAKQSLSAKVEKLKQLLVNSLKKEESINPIFISSPEEIIHSVLMHELSLTPKDLEEYENRPRAIIQSDLIMQVSQQSSEKQTKAALCEKFFKLLKMGVQAFKALTDNALLKTWEYTVASFAEVRANFGKWNMYSSLGMAPDDKDGIGEVLFSALKVKLNEANAKVQEFHELYEGIFSQVKYIEGRMKRASSEKELHWQKIEWQNRCVDLNHYQELRDNENYKAKRFANLFNYLIDLYLEKFTEYFQEIYDPDMHDITAGPYDDSPAGFRLFYKAGRAASAKWRSITTPDEFIDCLAGFFVLTEGDIVHNPSLEGLEDEVSSLVTSLVNHVKSRDFLESAFYRMAVAHKVHPIKNPLENLSKVEKKPWVYTSGGTMGSLVSCYFGREEKPTEVERWVESSEELLVFLIDTLKGIPNKVLEPYENNPYKSFLIHSPTHAFLLKPGIDLYQEAWQSKVYTYTWVRENYINPRMYFIGQIILNDSMIYTLIEWLSKKIPASFREIFLRFNSSMSSRMTCRDFRTKILNLISFERIFQMSGVEVLSASDIDSCLFEMLPLFPSHTFKTNLQTLLKKMELFSDEAQEGILKLYDNLGGWQGGAEMFGAKDFAESCMALLLLYYSKTSSSIDFYKKIIESMHSLGYAMPPSFLFADTNWVKNYFGFVINPGTEELELWRLNSLGTYGHPMVYWKQWLDGSRKDRTWGIYTQPHEYKGFSYNGLR